MRLLSHRAMRIIISVLCLLFASCQASLNNPRELVISDLPFHKASNAKEYADFVLKAIRTNRDIPINQEFELAEISVNGDRLNEVIGMYSTGIGGRDDWNFYDIHSEAASLKGIKGFDYAWLDPKGRLGIQIYIQPVSTENGFALELLELRSRLSVMDSEAFPGGEISDYKKIDYDWSKFWTKRDDE